MDIELTYLDDGHFTIDCGDQHRALALWLEQSWDDECFQAELAQSRDINALPMVIRSVEYSAYIRSDDVQVFAHVNSDEPLDDQGQALTLLDISAECGYEDYLHLLDFLRG
ncbi:YacL family protein [Celerinatantimonas yamalensis]|uniref:YacL family protein n=1 Tax=Celerinatantimonas yamalensis TaxID=559956 RepID=A0ABW9G523_9GAMM